MLQEPLGLPAMVGVPLSPPPDELPLVNPELEPEPVLNPELVLLLDPELDELPPELVLDPPPEPLPLPPSAPPEPAGEPLLPEPPPQPTTAPAATSTAHTDARTRSLCILPLCAAFAAAAHLHPASAGQLQLAETHSASCVRHADCALLPLARRQSTAAVSGAATPGQLLTMQP